MKKYGRYMAVCLILAMLTLLGGCGDAGKPEMGQWADNVFTNSWYDITVTIPDGYQVLGADEIKNLLGAGQEVIVNDGLVSKEELKKTEGNTIYDFYVFDADGTASLALGYEKLPASCDEEAYLKIVKENLEGLESIPYEVGEPEKVTVGKHEYLKISATLYEGAVFQEYYVHRKDGYMGFLIMTCNEKTKEELQSVIQQIQ